MKRSIFSDSHSHSNPLRGMGARRIAEAFAKEGGWFIAFIMLPSWDYLGQPLFDLDKYEELVRLHSRDCREAASSRILEVRCFAGLHPAEIDKLIELGKSPGEVRSYALSVVKKLESSCRSGEIDGIGEVGRMHYKVPVHSALIAQEVLEAAAEAARDSGCPMQLHLEQVPGFTAESISRLAQKLGTKKEAIIIHHSTVAVSKEAGQLGLWSTVLGRKEVISAALRERGSELLLLESDFIDDPSRPGKVIYPWDIARSLSSLIESGELSEEEAEKISVDNVKKFFGI